MNPDKTEELYLDRLHGKPPPSVFSKSFVLEPLSQFCRTRYKPQVKGIRSFSCFVSYQDVLSWDGYNSLLRR